MRCDGNKDAEVSLVRKYLIGGCGYMGGWRTEEVQGAVCRGHDDRRSNEGEEKLQDGKEGGTGKNFSNFNTRKFCFAQVTQHGNSVKRNFFPSRCIASIMRALGHFTVQKLHVGLYSLYPFPLKIQMMHILNGFKVGS